MANNSALSALVLHPTASTGAVTSTSHHVRSPSGYGALVALQFVVEAVGATPTVDFKFQGSLDGTNWYDVAYITSATSTLATAAITVTGTGASVVFLENSTSRGYNLFRCVTANNTNVTFRSEMWVERV